MNEELEHEIEDDGEEITELRDLLEAAVDESEETGGPEEDTEESVGDPEAKETPRDEQGRFVGEELPAVEEVAQLDHLAKPPASWKPAVQQEWNNLPPAVREEVYRRENDIQRYLHETAQTRKIGEEVSDIVAPFMPLIESEGSTPQQAIQSMMQTAAVLKTGSPVQKASALAHIVQAYGVPLELLDTILSEGLRTGAMQPDPAQMEMPQQPPNPEEIASMVEQRLVAQQQQAVAVQGVKAFIEDHPPAQYLRNEMADLIDQYGMTLQEAYDNAILNHPELKSLEQPAQPPQQQVNRAQRARKAASSLRSSPTPKTDSQPESLREALEQAFEG